jgi:hypothetical protein
MAAAAKSAAKAASLRHQRRGINGGWRKADVHGGIGLRRRRYRLALACICSGKNQARR